MKTRAQVKRPAKGRGGAATHVARAATAGAPHHEAVLDLQRTAGNKVVVQRLDPPGRNQPVATGPSFTATDNSPMSTRGTRWIPAYQAAIARGMSTPGVLGSYQATRAKMLVEHMVEADWVDFKTDLDDCKTDLAQAFALKALAAGKPLPDVERFMERIAGRSERWLIRNLTVVEWTTSSTAKGKGMIQQYGNTCGATTAQVVLASMDPIYALDLRSKTGDLQGSVSNASSNPMGIGATLNQAQEQWKLHNNAANGTVIPVSDRSNPMGGAWVEGAMNQQSGQNGVSFGMKLISASYSRLMGWLDIKRATAVGLTVPIVVGAQAGDTAHYCLIMRVEGEKIQIHDPWSGEVIWRTKDDLLKSTLKLPSTHESLTGVDVPKIG